MMARLALRSLLTHKLRFLFTVIAVTLGVSFVSGTMVFRDTATRGFDVLYEDLDEVREVLVRPEQPFRDAAAPPRLIPAGVYTTIEREVPAAAELYGQVEGYAAILGPDGEAVGAGAVARLGRAFVERAGSQQRITVGRAPRGPDEVVVEEHTAAEGGIGVGGSARIVAQNGARTMRVVGIFTLGDEWEGELVTYVGFAPETARELVAEPGHYTAIGVGPDRGVSQDQLIAQLVAALPDDYDVITAAQQAEDAQEEIDLFFNLLSAVLLGFAGVSVLFGSFIIFNTFTILTAQRTRELALLRAVGASRRQVTRAVLGEATGIGLLGSVLGLGAGVGVSLLLRLLFGRLTTPLPAQPPVIAPETVIWSVAVGVAVTMLAAYLPARRGARVPPVAALRDDAGLPGRTLTRRLIGGAALLLLGGLGGLAGVAAGGEEGAVLVGAGGLALFLAMVVAGPLLSGPVIRVLGWPIARLAGAVGRLSRENALRDRRRSAATASTLMIGLALVSMATVLADSTSASVARELDQQFAADYTMSPRGLTGFDPGAIADVAAVPQVRTVVAVRHGSLRMAGDEASILVADPVALAGLVSLEVEAGTLALGDDELLVQSSVAARRGWHAGSTVSGQYPDGTTTTLRVAGIVADNQVLSRPYLVSPDSYQPRATGNLVRTAFIDIDDDAFAAGRDGVLAALRAFPDIELKDRQDAKDEARRDVDQVLNLILVLLVLSIVIAAMGIVNTLGLSVIERTREIGLLRAVGMGRSQVRAMIRYESVVIASFGAVLGLALGVGLGAALQRALASAGIGVLSVSPGRLGAYLLSAIVIGAVAALWPARRAARLNVLEAIHQP